MQDLNERYLAAKRRLFERVYGAHLNPEQCRAVFTAKGPLLVLAGAGSGKTTVLVNRICYLIKYGNAYADTTVPEGVSVGMVEALEELSGRPPEEIGPVLPEFIADPCPPWNMLAFTFTNKAAREIGARLRVAFDDPSVAEAVWAGTFHSICVRILHKYGDRLGYRPGFSIYDTDDKKRLITRLMKELDIDERTLNPKVVAERISAAKDALRTPDTMDADRDPRTEDIRRIYRTYQARLMEYNAMDFDDIIMQTVFLLQTDGEVLSYYQNKFHYVSVDEYQDTNYAQFVLTSLLSGGSGNLMVVGDDDQSIYRFRGATVENILNFDKTYPHAAVVKLEQNYRSTSNILDAANAVIHNNGHRHEKSLWCERGAGEKITVFEAQDNIAEGRYIVDRIVQGVRTQGKHYSDFAVLYRINELARSLESSFAKSGIPYRILGSQRFTDRKEIRDVLAYLCLIATPADDLRLKRVINEPKRKIGAATVEAVEGIARATGKSMYQVMAEAEEYVALAKSAEKLTAFTRMLDALRQEHLTPSALIPAVTERTGYRDMLLAEGGFEGQSRMESIEEFVSAAVEYEGRCAEAGTEPTLTGFLEEIALVSDVDKYDENADAVVLMTVHSAKGLEFPVVFLAGMEDGIFPSQKCVGEPEEMNEERRLCYVAITRAKEKLYVTYAKSRLLWGRTNYGVLSSFIRGEVPGNLIETPLRRPEPPRAPLSYTTSPHRRQIPSEEFRRPPEFNSFASRGDRRPAADTRHTPASYGVERFAPGTRVSHAVFGEGTVNAARDMGGDVLYDVTFDSGEKKKLMATYARLKKV